MRLPSKDYRDYLDVGPRVRQRGQVYAGVFMIASALVLSQFWGIDGSFVALAANGTLMTLIGSTGVRRTGRGRRSSSGLNSERGPNP